MTLPSPLSTLRARRAPFIVALLLFGALSPYPSKASPVPSLPGYAHPPVVPVIAPDAPVAPSVRGVASWYGNPAVYGAPTKAWYTRETKWGAPIAHYAAAGPELRDLLGDDNPYHEHYPVTVTNPKTGITIKAVVTDWCGCMSGSRHEKLIDLAPAAFEALGVSLTRGIQLVDVRLGHDPEVVEEELPPSARPRRVALYGGGSSVVPV